MGYTGTEENLHLEKQTQERGTKRPEGDCREDTVQESW